MGGIHNGVWYPTTAAYNAAVEADSAGQTVTQGTPWPYGPVGANGVVPVTHPPASQPPVPPLVVQPPAPPVVVPPAPPVVVPPASHPSQASAPPVQPAPAPAQLLQGGGSGVAYASSPAQAAQQILTDKIEYEAILAALNGATPSATVQQNLDYYHNDALAGAAYLESQGLSAAAGQVEGLNSSEWQTYIEDHATEFNATPGNPTTPTAPSAPAGGGNVDASSGSPGGSEGLNGYSAPPTANGGNPNAGGNSFLAGLGTMLTSIFTGNAGATVGQDLTGIGQGAGTGAQAAAAGAGAGVGSAISSVLGSVTNYFWPIVGVLALVVWNNKEKRKRR